MNPVLLLSMLAASPPSPVSPEHYAKLAETGRCAEALAPIKRLLPRVSDPTMKRRLGVAGVRCATTLNRPDDAVDLLRGLDHDFPKDPEILYLQVHAYSDLSVRASQRLLFDAPDSPQVHELNAESLEGQGRWDQAAEEYRRVLEKNPNEPGIHYRLGRLILSRPKTDTTMEDARKEMEAEVAVDPKNAGAEFVLGEIARQGEQWPQAIDHFGRATTLDAGFADAWLGLGRALLASDKFSEAVHALEQAAKLQPNNPTMHYELSIAYRRAGRREDADREAALQQQTTQRAQEAKDSVQKGVQGIK